MDDKERQQREAANIAALVAVATALDANVTKRETQWGGGRVWCVRDARTFALEFYERPKRHVTISGVWPMYADADGHKRYVTPKDANAIKYNDTPPEARAAADRDAESIARDFTRRFFPEFIRCWDACLAYCLVLDRAAHGSMDLAQEFAQHFGGTPKAQTGSYGLSPSATLYVGTVGAVQFECWRGKGSVRIERTLGMLSPDKARRILDILAEEEIASANA